MTVFHVVNQRLCSATVYKGLISGSVVTWISVTKCHLYFLTLINALITPKVLSDKFLIYLQSN